MAANDRPDLPVEEVEERLKTRAELAQILDRGMTLERLSVAHLIPNDRVGIFVRRREASIARHRALGFRVETVPKEARGDNSHDVGDGSYVVGDVVLMTAPRSVYNMIMELHRERTTAKLEQSRRDFRHNMEQLGVTHQLDKEV